jgi:hypothetical protein
MARTTQRQRAIKEAKERQRQFKREDSLRKQEAKRAAKYKNNPLFDKFCEVTDTRHIFTFLASPMVADKNKPVSQYIANRVSQAVKVNYSDLFFSSLTNVYHYMIYEDFEEYMTQVCGVTLTEDNIKHYFHDIYFPRFQNTEVYTRLWPKLGQNMED